MLEEKCFVLLFNKIFKKHAADLKLRVWTKNIQICSMKKPLNNILVQFADINTLFNSSTNSIILNYKPSFPKSESFEAIIFSKIGWLKMYLYNLLC